MEFRTWQEIEEYYKAHCNEPHNDTPNTPDIPNTPNTPDTPDIPDTPNPTDEIRAAVAAEMDALRDSLLKELKATNIKTAETPTPTIPDFIDVLRGVNK